MENPPSLMGKSTISMAIFNSYVCLPEGKSTISTGPWLQCRYVQSERWGAASRFPKHHRNQFFHLQGGGPVRERYLWGSHNSQNFTLVYIRWAYILNTGLIYLILGLYS